MEQKARDKVISVVLCNSKNLHLSVGVLLINMYLFFSLSLADLGNLDSQESAPLDVIKNSARGKVKTFFIILKNLILHFV
jgi:hypothetical protein